jgi:1-deoxy-D-xylulose 5-phosphate reductoisomerase
LVLGAVIEALGGLERRKFQNYQPMEREVAFEAADFAAANEIAAAEFLNERRDFFAILFEFCGVCDVYIGD